MLFLTRGRWRTATTAVAAGALAATTLAFAGSPAQATEEGTVTGLNWNISEQYVGHFTANYGPAGGTITATDGAQFTDGDISYSYGDVSVTGGVTTVDYVGTITGVFQNMGVEQYRVAVADPKIVFDASGAGEILATVSSAEIDEDPTARAEVKVAEFSDGALVDGVFAATPDFEGVLPAGSDEATALVEDEGHPVAGRSFHPEFIGHLTPGVRAHFYATGDNQPKKAVADIEAAVFLPTVTASATTSGNKVTISLDAKNFDPAWRPGANGVYVGLSQERNIFKVDSTDQASGMGAFLSSSYLSTTAFNEGAWSGNLTIRKKQLAKGIDYVIYTWTAHGNPLKGDSQYTATPVKISGLTKAPTKVGMKWKKKPSTKKKAKLVVTAKSTVGKINTQATPSTKVKVTLKKGKQTKKTTVKLNKKGKAAVKIGKLGKGKWKIVVKYTGDKTFKKSKKAKKFKVKK